MSPSTHARSLLRIQILAALGVSACNDVPQAKVSDDQALYEGLDQDGDGSPAIDDCNDIDPNIHPGANELCNAIDDNCDGQVDEGVFFTFYRDADGDGYGNPDSQLAACEPPTGYINNDEDCNDLSANAFPGGTEVCDGIDNNCDGNTDDIDGWWPDLDNDGYAGTGAPRSACEPRPDGYSNVLGDCNDGDPMVNPGMGEVCQDGVDNDCDGLQSCLVADITEPGGADCTVTWAMTSAEAVDWNSPCVGCDFTFEARMTLASIEGDSALCDDMVEVWATFDVQNPADISRSTGPFLPSGWSTSGAWDGDILDWTSAAHALGGAFSNANLDYTGQLLLDEVSYYSYYYYGYEGRPFTVGGDVRTSTVVGGSDWCVDVRVHAEATADDRLAAAEAWTRAALAEHAAIASFARFTMELMSLGAPPDLLQAAIQATADEVRHAQDAFAVASAFAGRDLSPSPLPMDGALADPSVRGILERLLTEGCVDETVSTALAALRLSHVQDTTLVNVLTRIVDDESRHAALAWKTARWILQQHPSLVPFARTVLAEATEARPLPIDAPVSPGLRSLGGLSRRETAFERARTLSEVVAPAIDALFRGLEAPATAPAEAQEIWA